MDCLVPKASTARCACRVGNLAALRSRSGFSRHWRVAACWKNLTIRRLCRVEGTSAAGCRPGFAAIRQSGLAGVITELGTHALKEAGGLPRVLEPESGALRFLRSYSHFLIKGGLFSVDTWSWIWDLICEICC